MFVVQSLLCLQGNGRGRTSSSSSSSRRSSARSADNYERVVERVKAAQDDQGEVWPSLEKFKDMLRKVSAECSSYIFLEWSAHAVNTLVNDTV
jgi:hypothetical protein